MKIEKGHYVPKELITSEAVHEAVVKCFAAAGFHRNRDYVDYRAKEHWGCIAISGSGVICWSDKQEHSLTLQQLFTAENSLQWPDWAESINSYGPNCVAFYGECSVVLIAGNLMEFERNDAAILATRQPKEKEVKEKSPLGEYEWGKEYPTNGKRPELPDDVVVSVKWSGADWRKDSEAVGYFNFEHYESFRITDPRYKPDAEVSEISESKPDAEAVSEKPESNWFERGERPPVGAEFEVYNHTFGKNADWERCKILWRGEFLTVYASDSHHECSASNDHLEFRPIKAKTEREKFIEAALVAVDQPEVLEQHVFNYFGLLFDAGFQAPKVDK